MTWGTRKEGNSVATPCGLHSNLRQHGTGLWPGFFGTVKTVPFRFVPQQADCTVQPDSRKQFGCVPSDILAMS